MAAREQVRDARDRVIARLSDHFAHDVLAVDEFERRVTVAHTAESVDEIEALVADLPASEAATKTALAAAPSPTRALATTTASVPELRKLYAVMGGSTGGARGPCRGRRSSPC